MTTNTRHDDDVGLRQETASNATRHAEWLMDEAIRDSFPASDPASPSQPGSIVYERYAATQDEVGRGGRFRD